MKKLLDTLCLCLFVLNCTEEDPAAIEEKSGM